MISLSPLNFGLSLNDLAFSSDLLNSRIPISIVAKIGMYLNPEEAAQMSSTCRLFAASKSTLELFTCAEWKKEMGLISEFIPIASDTPTLETIESLKLKFSLKLFDALLSLPEDVPSHLALVDELKHLKVPVLAAFEHHRIVRDALNDVDPAAGLSRLGQLCECLIYENRLIEALAIVSKMPLSARKSEAFASVLRAGLKDSVFISFLQKSPQSLIYSYALRDLIDGMIAQNQFKEARDVAAVIPDPFVKARAFTSIDVSQYPLAIRFLPDSCRSVWQQARDVVDVIQGNRPLFRFRI